MRNKKTKPRIGILGWTIVLFVLMLMPVAHASYTNDFSYPAGSSLPGYFTIIGSQAPGSSVTLTGSSMNVSSNNDAGSFYSSGSLPTMEFDTTVGTTWKISTTFTADWFGDNNLIPGGNSCFPGLGILIGDGLNGFLVRIGRDTNYAGSGNGADRLVVGKTGTTTGGIIDWGGGIFYTGSEGVYTTSSADIYTLWVEKLGDGSYSIGANIDGTIQSTTIDSSSTGVAAEAFSLFNDIGNQNLSFFAAGDTYSADGRTAQVTGAFDSVTIDGLDIVGVPEPATLGLLTIGGAITFLKRRK